jgi:hypothetical protein
MISRSEVIRSALWLGAGVRAKNVQWMEGSLARASYRAPAVKARNRFDVQFQPRSGRACAVQSTVARSISALRDNDHG